MKEESIVAIYLAAYNEIKPEDNMDYEVVYDRADRIIKEIQPLLEAYTQETK
jgi:hypothetical protein